MPATPSGEIKKSVIRSKRDNGDIYLLERESIYIPEKKYNKILGSRLIGKIPKGETEPVPTRPKLPNGEKKNVKSGVLTASRERIGMDGILEFIGDDSGIDQTLYKITDKGTAQKIISIARYLVATNGTALSGLTTWQLNHPLPYEDGISENVYHDLFTDIGLDETLQQSYFKTRCDYLSPKEGIAYDSTTISTYSVNQADVWRGFNNDGYGLDTIKFVALYSAKDRQPVAFAKHPGNISDVSSITNAINELQGILGVNRPELITDNGYYSEQTLSEILQAGFHTITLADKNVNWIRKVIDEHRHELENFESCCPFDPEITGITVPIMHTFKKVQKYDSTKKNLEPGDVETFQRRIHVHIYFNEESWAHDRNKLRRELAAIKKMIEEGKDIEQFSPQDKKKTDTYFTIQKRGKEIYAISNNEAIQSSYPYHGMFVLISTKENDTWRCLSKYRRRNTIESFFEAEKGHADGKRPEVWSEVALRGRMFVQFIALSYYEYFNEKIRGLKETLGLKNGDPKHDLKGNLDDEKELKTWIENTPLYLQLQWFDSIERICISTKLKKKRWAPEIIERDRLYLNKLGITLK